MRYESKTNIYVLASKFVCMYFKNDKTNKLGFRLRSSTRPCCLFCTSQWSLVLSFVTCASKHCLDLLLLLLLLLLLESSTRLGSIIGTQ